MRELSDRGRGLIMMRVLQISRSFLICFFTVFFAMMVCVLPMTFAEQRIIEADGFYTIGDGLDENISTAKERAKADALRNASEQASVFVEGLSVVQEGQLTRDEVKVISANIMQMQGAPKFKVVPVSDDVIRYECHVTALVDTDNINAKLVQDRQSLDEAVRRNKELAGEVERLNREMEQLKQQYASASTEQERRQIRQEAKRNEEGFAAAQLNEQGAALCSEGRYREAVTIFTEALAKNPNFAYAYHNRGIAYGKLQEYREAVSDFSRAISLDANYATAYSGRGFAYYGLDDYMKAAGDFSKAISLNPSYAEAYYGRGNAYMSLGHYGEALRDYERALTLNPRLDAAKENRDTILQAMNG